MFSIFKTKIKSADDEFKKGLSLFADFFSQRVTFLNNRQANELVSTVFAVYLERNPEESGQSVCDFFFDSMVGNIFDAINQGALDKHTALIMWRQTNRFLSEHSEFDSNVSKLCMHNWKEVLIGRGVDSMNFDIG